MTRVCCYLYDLLLSLSDTGTEVASVDEHPLSGAITRSINQVMIRQLHNGLMEDKRRAPEAFHGFSFAITA